MGKTILEEVTEFKYLGIDPEICATYLSMEEEVRERAVMGRQVVD